MHTILKFCPRCGSPRFLSQDRRLFRCSDCDLHFYRNITTAVAGILVDPQHRVLLIRRARNPALGKLAFPGGFIDEQETAEGALRREIREEVGLDAPTVSYIGAWPNRYEYKSITYDVLDLIFACPVPSLDGKADLDEVSGLVTQPLHEVNPADLAFPSLRNGLLALQANPDRWLTPTL